MKKTIIILSLFLSIICNINAQYNWNLVQEVAPASTVSPWYLTTRDHSGNIIFSTFSNENLNIKGNTIPLVVNRKMDYTITKLSPSGDYLWSFPLNQKIAQVDFDSTGNIYACGTFTDTLFLGKDTIVNNNSIEDAIVFKLSPTGGLLWVKRSESFSKETATAIRYNNGKVYIAGNYVDSIRFGNKVIPYTPKIFLGIGSKRTCILDSSFILRCTTKTDSLTQHIFSPMYINTLDENGKSIDLNLYYDTISHASESTETFCHITEGCSCLSYYSNIYNPTLLYFDSNQTLIVAGTKNRTCGMSGKRLDVFIKSIATGEEKTLAFNNEEINIGKIGDNIVVNARLDATKKRRNINRYSTDGSSLSEIPWYYNKTFTINETLLLNIGGNHLSTMDINGNILLTDWITSSKQVTIENACTLNNNSVLISGMFDNNAVIGVDTMVGKHALYICPVNIDNPQNTIRSKVYNCIYKAPEASSYTAFDSVDFRNNKPINNTESTSIIEYYTHFAQRKIQDIHICNNKPYFWKGNYYTQPITLIDTIKTPEGCDSIIETTLHFEGFYKEQDLIICEGNSVLGHTTSGTYIDTLITKEGCDSIVKTFLQINPALKTTITKTLCKGESFMGYTQSGTYTKKIQNINNCDSIYTIIINVTPTYNDTISKTICHGNSINGHSENGTYTDTLQSKYGCDSIVTLHLSVRPPIESSKDVSICQGETFKGHTTSSTFEEHLLSKSGCDSTIYYDLTVKELPELEIADTIKVSRNSPATIKPTNHTGSLLWINGSTNDSLIVLGDTLTDNKQWWVKAEADGCSNQHFFVVKLLFENKVLVMDNNPSKLFPNPAIAHLSVTFTSNEIGKNCNISILNANGQTVLTQVYENTNEAFTIDISQLVQGTYQVMVNNTYLGQIVKQ